MGHICICTSIPGSIISSQSSGRIIAPQVGLGMGYDGGFGGGTGRAADEEEEEEEEEEELLGSEWTIDSGVLPEVEEGCG